MNDPEPGRAGRVAGRGAAGPAVLAAGAVGFTALLALVTTDSPLLAVDRRVAAALNDLVAERPAPLAVLDLVTDLGGSPTSWIVLTTLAVALAVRRRLRLAAFVAVSGLGAAVLSPAVKELVGRVRPVVDVPVAAAPGPSFPSGHALGSTVTYGVLVLVFLPAVPRRLRGAVVAAAAVLVVAIGFTRLALGVHFLSDVLAGWLLGLAWLATTTTAFRARRRASGPPGGPGLPAESAPARAPAPRGEAVPAPHPGRRAAALLAVWVLLFGVLLDAGWLVTRALAGSPVERVDAAVVRWLAAHRSPGWTTIAHVVSPLGSTAVVVTLGLVAAALALEATRRWRPVLFLAVALVGEVTLFLATMSLVGRPRPPVEHLGTSPLPTSSFPSGHVAAATTLYGAVAVLVLRRIGAWWRWLVVIGAALAAVAVAATRLYYGVHYPTDVAGSVLLAVPWLAACTYLVRPGPRPAGVTGRAGPPRCRAARSSAAGPRGPGAGWSSAG